MGRISVRKSVGARTRVRRERSRQRKEHRLQVRLFPGGWSQLIDGLECCAKEFTVLQWGATKGFKKKHDTISYILESHLKNYF